MIASSPEVGSDSLQAAPPGCCSPVCAIGHDLLVQRNRQVPSTRCCSHSPWPARGSLQVALVWLLVALVSNKTGGLTNLRFKIIEHEHELIAILR